MIFDLLMNNRLMNDLKVLEISFGIDLFFAGNFQSPLPGSNLQRLRIMWKY
jgi:hypothetical protein